MENYKSIRNGSLDFRGLTVLVGENSAGKSSLIQAILLMAQIPHVPTHPTTVGLNGTELQFGDFSSICHVNSQNSQVKISLYVPESSLGDAKPLKPRHVSQVDWSEDYDGPDFAPVDVFALTLGDPGDIYGVADLKRIEVITGLETAFLDDERTILDVSQLTNPDAVNELLEPSIYTGTLDPVSNLAMMISAGIRAPGIYFSGYDGPFISEDEQVPDEVSFNEPLVAVEQGFPVESFGISDSLSKYFFRWWDQIVHNTTESLHKDCKVIGGNERLDNWIGLPPEEIAKIILPEFERYRAALTEVGNKRLHLHPGGSTNDRFEFESLDYLQKIRFEIFNQIQTMLYGQELSPPVLVGGGVAGGVFTALAIRQRLDGSVHYLGPLRAGPSALQQEGQAGRVATLGISGEYAIAVLSQRQNEIVKCPVALSVTEEMTLLEAVNHWINALGVASSLDIHQRGRMGLELEVKDLQDTGNRDLSAIGVGVSQLLPVIVLCLVAEPGELILIEQPELHLHPAPQQVLADFFIGVMQSGRQVVIETHSEYLIDRLRLRVAEDFSGSLTEQVDVYYASRRHGETEFEELNIDEYGNFHTWPEGFFDQAGNDSENILQAALRKLKSAN